MRKAELVHDVGILPRYVRHHQVGRLNGTKKIKRSSNAPGSIRLDDLYVELPENIGNDLTNLAGGCTKWSDNHRAIPVHRLGSGIYLLLSDRKPSLESFIRGRKHFS